MHRTHVILLHGDSGDVGHGLHAELQQGLPRLLLAAAVLGSGLTIRPDFDLIIGLGLGLLLVLVGLSVELLRDFAHLWRGLQTPMQIARVRLYRTTPKIPRGDRQQVFFQLEDRKVELCVTRRLSQVLSTVTAVPLPVLS
jgi:hypothetical protein